MSCLIRVPRKSPGDRPRNRDQCWMDGPNTAGPTQRLARLTSPSSPLRGRHIRDCCAPFGPSTKSSTCRHRNTLSITREIFPRSPHWAIAGRLGGLDYSSQVFDLTQPLIYNPAFIALQAGSTPAEMLMNAENSLIAGIIGGQTYFNIHTSNFPAGEIRGQLAPVPLPAALPLFAAGLGIVTFLARRKKSTAVSPM